MMTEKLPRRLRFETLCGCTRLQYEPAGSTREPLPEIRVPLRLPTKIHYEVGKSDFTSDISQVSTIRCRSFQLVEYRINLEFPAYELLYREKA